MSSRFPVWCVVNLCAALGVGSSWAYGQSRDATLTRVEGVVYLNEQLVTPRSSALALGDPVTLRTEEGRAVVALKHGGILTLNDHTQVRVRANGSYNFSAVEILEGTAVVVSNTSAPLVTCQTRTRLSSDGVFRFDVVPGLAGASPTCRFRVYDGAAAVPLVSVTSALRSGQTMTLDPTCGDMVQTNTFPVDQVDDFDRWSRLQADGRR